jgi:hypothetical protein
MNCHTRGPEEGVVAREQELAAGGSHGGSGDGGATWREQERPARAGEAAARAPGQHVARFRAARAAGARHMAGEAVAERRAERNRAEQRKGGLKVDEGTDLLFSKSAGAPL